ncbi:MAG: hypothetical protein OHK0046_34920 [Anaerolineae bacterium]
MRAIGCLGLLAALILGGVGFFIPVRSTIEVSEVTIEPPSVQNAATAFAPTVNPVEGTLIQQATNIIGTATQTAIDATQTAIVGPPNATQVQNALNVLASATAWASSP